jgi:hypothetical protein
MVNTGDTCWLLISSALVMLMTPGLALFYGGMVRRKNVLSTIMMSFAMLGLVGILWLLYGYSLSFGPDIGGVIGKLDWVLLRGVGQEPSDTYATTVPHLAFMIFQAMFAIITVALWSGGVVERMKFSAFLLIAVLWFTLVYCPVTHWVWGSGGWLAKLGCLDFASGIVVSSQAERLKPHAIDVKSPVDPIHWFLDGKEDVRSSYFLEDVVTEFQVQGLELDWACVAWDADFRYTKDGWEHLSFIGDRWNHIRKQERQVYLKNAYRVLLTRARQGVVIVVPSGDPEDLTRKNEFYDPTFEYLQEIGFKVI